jgi:hypothetical protein
MRGEGLVSRQVAAGQGGGAGLLTEHLHPAPVLLRVLPASGRRSWVDGDRGLDGEFLHLAVGLARQL